ncbi:MAG: FtsQ-type POTRA domain-containing protein [Clostridia bacterium]|nr:FtsQ-type POTRA domain-containing protein [Clostridia bacterium]
MPLSDIKAKDIRINKKQAFAVVCIIIGILFVSLFTPMYDISEISVEGNSAVSSDILVRASGIAEGESLFKVNPREAEEKLKKVACIDTVRIKRVFPGKVRIIVTESTESAYISFAGNYIGIDSGGKILEVRQQLDENAKPVVNGVRISNFTIGSYIDVDDEGKKQLLFELLSAISEEGVDSSIYSIDITDTENIFLVLKSNITVKLGNADSIRYKTAYLKTVLPEISNETGGVLDISDTDNVIYTN